MKAVYIESSGILSWLFGEKGSEKIISLLNESDVCVSSVLSILETERVLLRAVKQNLINEGQRQRLRGIFNDIITGWSFMEINSEIRERAAREFPVEPIRSLDAIHLSTALEFLQIYPELNILTLDKRIQDNIMPLGLTSAFQ